MEELSRLPAPAPAQGPGKRQSESWSFPSHTVHQALPGEAAACTGLRLAQALGLPPREKALLPPTT